MKARAVAMLLLFAPALLAQEQRAYLDLFLNDVQRETVLVRLRGEPIDDALVAVEDLEKAGLHGLGGAREVHDGREYVSLKSLGPRIEFRIDQQALAVRLTARPEMLERQRVDMTPLQRPRELVLHRDTSAFLNYSVTGDSSGAFSGAAELGASVRGTLAYTGLNVLPTGEVVRGLSNVVLDDTARMRRFTFGDASITPTSSLGGGGLLAGLSIAREFSLDPYFIRQPLPRLAGSILTPSTLDLYVNGVLVRQQQLAPGQFEVRNLPVPSGAGQVSYVVRDAFGRTQEFSSPYYSTSGVLADGISEYGYQLGVRRVGLGVESLHYDWPQLLARHRIGIGDWLTAGYRFESSLQDQGGRSLLASGGPTFAFALPLGELDLDAALSTDGGAAGTAAALSYALFARGFSVGASARAQSGSYANLSQPAALDRPRLQLLGSVGAPVAARLTLTLEGQLNSMRDAGLSSGLAVRGDLRITNDFSVVLSVSRTRKPGEDGTYGAFATLLYNFGSATTADFGVNGGTQSGASAGVQKSLPIGEGLAWQLRSAVDNQQPASGLGQVQYQGAFGSYVGSYTRSGNADSGSATAAGALVMVDGNVMASRPVQEGFALIQVPGVPGVRGYLNNQEIGRTNGSGNLLVPALQPYYGNRLSIGDADIPIDYDVGRTEQMVATPVRGGALVRFQVQRMRSVAGMVRVDGKVPAYGELSIDSTHKSPLGAKGEFWFDNLAVGGHEAQVEFAEGVCRFKLEVPEAGGPAIDVGTVTCSQMVAAAK